ncbi:Uncharacterized protein APZ42_006556, partial [Daphnia magna]
TVSVQVHLPERSARDVRDQVDLGVRARPGCREASTGSVKVRGGAKQVKEAKQKRHEERSHHMEQLAADRRELIELKRREVAFREEKNNMIRQLALNKNNNDPQDVFLYSNEH